MTLPYYIGLDVGGTTMKAGVVDDTGRPLSNVGLPTEPHRGQEFGLARMCETIRLAASSAGVSLSDVSAIGVATPGSMDLQAGMILDPMNLKPWKNVPVRAHVQKEFGLPTAFQNDANAAAYGEYWAGSGKSYKSMVMFTLGTGIGGGIILHDRVVEGEHSHGGELGHIRIEMTNPRLCGCGKRGCLEAYASATAVVGRTREALDRGEASSLKFKYADLTARDVFAAAAAGDALGDRVVEETAFYLAVGAANVMHSLDPEVIVYAGGMTAAGEPFLERIRRHVRDLALPVPAERTKLVYATLGSDAGLIGAAACARYLLKAKPGSGGLTV